MAATINEAIYKRTLRLQNAGILSGTYDRQVEIGDGSMPWDSPIVAAFLADDDIQEIQIVSTSGGFSKTLTKQYLKP